MFGVDPLVFMVAMLAYFYGRFMVTMSPRTYSLWSRKILMLEREIKRLRVIGQQPRREKVFASTGCVLTDQIFEAAREKGINPIDVIGPAPDYDIAALPPVKNESGFPDWREVDWSGRPPIGVRVDFAPQDIIWMYPAPDRTYPNGNTVNYDWLNNMAKMEEALKYRETRGYKALYYRVTRDSFILVEFAYVA